MAPQTDAPGMNVRSIALACLLFTLTYTALAFPWPGLTESYGAAYRGALNSLAAALGLDANLRVVASATPAGPIDSAIEVRQAWFAPQTSLPHSSRYPTYMTCVFFVSLMVATPLAWKRRVSLLAVGLAILHLYLATRLGLSLLLMNLAHPGELLPGVPLSADRAELLWEIAKLPWYVVPLLTWALLAGPHLRRSSAREARVDEGARRQEEAEEAEEAEERA